MAVEPETGRELVDPGDVLDPPADDEPPPGPPALEVPKPSGGDRAAQAIRRVLDNSSSPADRSTEDDTGKLCGLQRYLARDRNDAASR